MKRKTRRDHPQMAPTAPGVGKKIPQVDRVPQDGHRACCMDWGAEGVAACGARPSQGRRRRASLH
eukprot:365093-Chlamydomonas_euryale.AAC.13